jgi:hypothetical protein
LNLIVGAEGSLTASAFNAAGDAMSALFEWSSADPAIATVGRNDGVVTGVGAGSTTLTATVGTLRATATVSVRPPASPGYTLTAPVLSSPQGGGWSQHTMNLVRTNFTGNVTLSVENLPTGVSAFFYPFDLTSGSSFHLWLSVHGTAPTGTFTNLLVRGVAEGLLDRTAPLTLTITVAPFVLTVSSSTLTTAQGEGPQTTTFSVVRNDVLTGPVTLDIDENPEDGYPLGVTAAFAPNPTAGNSVVLSLTAGAESVPGVYRLSVHGEAATGVFYYWPLTLTITAAPSP